MLIPAQRSCRIELDTWYWMAKWERMERSNHELLVNTIPQTAKRDWETKERHSIPLPPSQDTNQLPHKYKSDALVLPEEFCGQAKKLDIYCVGLSCIDSITSLFKVVWKVSSEGRGCGMVWWWQILEAESARILLQSRSGLYRSDVQHIPQEGKTSSMTAFLLPYKKMQIDKFCYYIQTKFQRETEIPAVQRN
jgi:hypothetical protein